MGMFLAGLPLRAESAADTAEGHWAHRAEPGETEKAITWWQTELEHHLDIPSAMAQQLLIKLTRACGRAYRHSDDKTKKRQWADLAKTYGEKASKLKPESSEAYALYGEALGQWAEANKGLHSLKTVKQAVEVLKKAVALDPANAYAHMLLSQFYRASPGTISVGDKKKALEEGRLAVEYGPQYAINHIAYAKALMETGDKEAAIKELNVVLALSAPADAVPETAANKEDARELLKLWDATATSPFNGACGSTPDASGTCHD